MSAHPLDGRTLARQIEAELAPRVEQLKETFHCPCLAVVVVGDDPASRVYVRNKIRACDRTGIESFEVTLPADTDEATLLKAIDELNADEKVDGILVQLPLPPHLTAVSVIEAIAPEKDVDGFHSLSIGSLMTGRQGFVPCTPAGVMRLLQEAGCDPKGKRAVVVGRSNIVGKPLSLLLLAADATVTIAHSRTPDLSDLTRSADILVAAVGRENLITADMVKPGAVVIDVGINRNAEGKLCGDVAADVAEVASAITPVPGGVGPMTIAMLLTNTVLAAERRLTRTRTSAQS